MHLKKENVRINVRANTPVALKLSITLHMCIVSVFLFCCKLWSFWPQDSVNQRIHETVKQGFSKIFTLFPEKIVSSDLQLRFCIDDRPKRLKYMWFQRYPATCGHGQKRQRKNQTQLWLKTQVKHMREISGGKHKSMRKTQTNTGNLKKLNIRHTVRNTLIRTIDNQRNKET